MQHAVVKVQESGNSRVWLTERDTMLGYKIWWWTSQLPVMARMAPVIADITHSLQHLNQSSGVAADSGCFAARRAAVAAVPMGVVETHTSGRSAF